MNRSFLIWNIVLTLVCGYLLYLNGSSRGSAVAAPNSPKGATAGFQMAYFEMDSIAAHFDMVKELKTEMTKREDAIKSELDRLGKSMQQKLNDYQQQAKSGTMTQEQSDAASRDMRNMDDNLKSRQQSLESDYSDYVLRRQNEIKTRIEDFLKEFNKNSKYSYIVSYEPGLFYYKDTAHNITQNLIEGLNRQYKTQKK
ncbi:MAG: OmpH family outer membrane protein [Bacteroidota bacterium]